MKPSPPSALLVDYASQVEPTDRLPFDDLQPILLGLFGEVGSIMATAKKFHREGDAYAGYRHAVEEEFGDALWYFAALCRRLKVELGQFLTGLVEQDWQTDSIATPLTAPDLDAMLLRLGETTAALFAVRSSSTEAGPAIAAFWDAYLNALKDSRLRFDDVVRKNVVKTTGRFLRPDTASLPTFDDRFPAEEQLPRHFEITIDQRNGQRSYLRWHGVFIGDSLTDNIHDRDGYRFHSTLR